MQGGFMKRLLLATVAAVAFIVPGPGARAADMAVKAPPVPYAPPPFNWTGFYVGGNVGVGAVTGTLGPGGFGEILGNSVGGNLEFMGGGQIGYNWQFGPNIVFGVEWFFDGLANSNDQSVTFISPATGDSIAASVKADWVTTITGRIGFTIPTDNHWMFYLKGGGAWVQTQATISDLTVPGSIGVTKTVNGWVAGAGIEWAFAQNWTIKFEYQYLGLSNFDLGNGLLQDGLFGLHDGNAQMGTVGINYLFNWGAPAPVVSRY
jgi:outer membrane immunogenic protein